jgi:aryl-alcohol dehydrogenase-like predicted oxidoreductase
LLNKLGFGTWGIGGVSGKFGSYGVTDDTTSRSALLHAYNRGIRFFDTAPPYGHAEALLGNVFSEKTFPDIKVLTKVGINSWSDEVNFSSSFIIESIQNSLVRLKRKSVFAVILHSLKTEVKTGSVQEGFSTLAKLKNEGLIENIGFSCKSPSEIPQLLELYPETNIIEANYHLLDMRVRESKTQNSLQNNKPFFIARTPLCFGFLTDKISKDSDFDDLDHRSRWKQTRQKQIHNWVDGRIQLEAIFKSYGYEQPIQELALSFCLQNSLVDFVIPGMMNIEEVNGCLKSLEVKSFSKELLREIEVFNDKFNEIVVI